MQPTKIDNIGAAQQTPLDNTGENLPRIIFYSWRLSVRASKANLELAIHIYDQPPPIKLLFNFVL